VCVCLSVCLSVRGRTRAAYGKRARLARRRPAAEGGVLNITAAVWTAGFHWWHSGNKKRTQNASEYMLILALCLVFFITLHCCKQEQLLSVLFSNLSRLVLHNTLYAEVPVAVVSSEIRVSDIRQMAPLCVINLLRLELTDVLRTKRR